MNRNKIYPLQFILAIFIMVISGGCVTTSQNQSSHRGDLHPQEILSSDSTDAESFFIENDPGNISPIEVIQIPAQPAEPDQTVNQEIKELEDLGSWEEGIFVEPEQPQVTYDFPVTINKQVEYYLDFFQNKHRRSFSRWLKRSGRYLPMIQKELKKADLPQDLAYLAMIESGFSQIAYSRAKAMGMWQFIKGTGRKYNLKINRYIDERRHPVKATRAAIAYLTDLHNEFDSWYLSVAGYNAGEGKIRRAIKKYNTTNFWELAQGKYLKLETKRYVPKLIAAIIISKEPEKYGFIDIEYNQPLELEIIKVPRWTSLKAVAKAGNMKLKELQSLNRELRTQFTPPDNASYELRVPASKHQMIAANLSRVHATVSTNYKTHTVLKNETLTSICRRYGLSKTVILKANRLNSANFKAGQRLRIPYRTTKYELLPEGEASRLIAGASNENLILHKIQRSETVSEISLRYNVPPHLIAGWNDLKDLDRIRAGQQLALYINDALVPKQVVASKVPVIKKSVARKRFSSPVKTLASASVKKPAKKTVRKTIEPTEIDGKFIIHHTVRRGDSLWRIAKRYGVNTKSIKKWNTLKNDVIQLGAQLTLKVAKKPINEDRYYLVRGGDSLWTIAKKHNLPLKKIKEWNKLKNDVIHPGRKLLLKTGYERGV